MKALTTEHLGVVKHILRHVAKTLRFHCRYTRQSNNTGLIKYSNSDMAGDVDTHKSIMGVFFFLSKKRDDLDITKIEGCSCYNGNLPRSLAHLIACGSAEQRSEPRHPENQQQIFYLSQ